MLEIDCTVDGERIKTDLHSVRVPGLNVPATSLPGPDLLKECQRLKVPNVSTSDGWQMLCLKLALFIKKRDEAAEREAEAKFAASKAKLTTSGV